MEQYDATRAGQAIAAFVDELSNWYVRRSRRRFWDGDPAAFGTLKYVSRGGHEAARPVHPRSSPMRSSTTWTAASTSVHLADSRGLGERDVALETAMAVARETVRLGLAARGHGKLKVRQPLRAAVVVAAGEERAAIERLAPTVRRSSTSRGCASWRGPTSSGPSSGPNYRALGPRFGKLMPQVGGRRRRARAGARRGGAARRRARRDQHRGARPRARRRGPDARDAAARRATSSSARDPRRGARPQLDDELRREGLAREIVHAVQNARKGAGLQVEDRIELALGGDEELLAAARDHQAPREETLARERSTTAPPAAAEATSTVARCSSP